jgi:DNA-binding XRE family transcriptional regulator
MKYKNNIRKIREERLMSKSELARLAGVSPATIDRIERGEDCRVETKRKILLAFGFSLSEKEKIFLE